MFLLFIFINFSRHSFCSAQYSQSANECFINPNFHFSDEVRGGGSAQGRGITTISGSGLGYQPGPGHAQHNLGSAHLPHFPAPQMTGQVAQPQVLVSQSQPSVLTIVQSQVSYGGHAHYSAPVATVAPNLRAPPPRDERVDLNPGGRHKPGDLSSHKQGGSSLGSMESLNSNQDSVFSFGSTVSSNGELTF